MSVGVPALPDGALLGHYPGGMGSEIVLLRLVGVGLALAAVAAVVHGVVGVSWGTIAAGAAVLWVLGVIALVIAERLAPKGPLG